MSKNKLRLHRKKRVKIKVRGTAKRPRLSVFKSLNGISTQLINDETGKTLVTSDSKILKVENNLKGAEKIGGDLAKKCLKLNIKEVVFDRSGYAYHGQVKAVADGARKGGLQF